MLRAPSTEQLHDSYCLCNSSKCSIRKYITHTTNMLQLYLQTLQLDTPESQTRQEIRKPLQKLFLAFREKMEQKCRATQKERCNQHTLSKAHPNYCFYCSTIWNHVRRCCICQKKMYLCDKHKSFFGDSSVLACNECEKDKYEI